MQFRCESCQTTLHISDDKVKGKRLVVRCKKCGARINIADPDLGTPAGAAAPKPAAAVARPAQPQPASQPQAQAADGAYGEEEDSDKETTRAMDTNILEQALRESRGDEGKGAAAVAGQGPAGGPPAASQRDPATWFAMIASKQTGPLSRAELVLKVATGAVTGRSYVWKDGMAGWVRAAEVADLASLFAAPPAQKPAPIASPASSPAVAPKPAAKPAPDGAPAFALDVEVMKPAQPTASRVPSSPGRPFQPPAGATATGPQVQAGPGRAGASGRPQEGAGTMPEPAPAGPAGAGTKAAPPAGAKASPLPAGGNGPAAASSGGLEVKDLFASVESTGGHNAVDLAKWASAELSKKPGSPGSPGANSPRRMTPPSSNSAVRGAVPVLGAAGREPGGRRDGLAGVPAGHGAGASIDTTGKVLAKSGVTQSRTPMLIGLIVIGLAVIAGLVFLLLSKGDKPPPPPPPEAPKASLGGTGDTTVSKLAKQDGPGAPKADKGAKVAQADPAKGDKLTDKLTKEQLDALKGLDNDRGVGGHAPSGAAAPVPAKATPGLSSAEIRKTLVDNQGGLRACISDAQRRDPNLKVGKIKVSLLIAPSGTVTESKIDNAAVDGSPLGDCLKKATRRLAFPSFTGEPFPIDIPIQVTAGN